ncbi:MAG: hypothetical protein C0412_19680 [Flavobacterium sp.]|nr:hypothetical protein [Flavobacterium sp.]
MVGSVGLFSNHAGYNASRWVGISGMRRKRPSSAEPFPRLPVNNANRRANIPNHAVYIPGVPASGSNLRGAVPNRLGLTPNPPGLIAGKLNTVKQLFLSVFN